ncbi:MAG TPA: cytochrome P450 [Herpetosiphonaceae bacterium]
MTTAFPISTPLSGLRSIDITDARFKANPFPFYARLRDEAPVFPVTISVRGKQRAWLVTRYDDVLAVLKDDQRFVKDRRNAMSPAQLKKAPRMPALFKSLERNLLGLDGADHDRLKALVHKAFTPRMVEQMRDQTQAQVDAILDRAERHGGMELIGDLALPVPLTIIGRILGVPQEDEAKFGRWASAFTTISSRNPIFALPSILRFINYPRTLIARRRAAPKDDLISALVQAREGNDQLTDDEIVAMVVLLLTAGHETTVNLIGSGTLALLQHPDQLARLREEPTLIKSAIEELVRFVVPAEMATERYAAEDVTIAETTIPKGELVLAVIASANRDPRHFDQPDGLNITRTNNKHLSFGQGIHYCLGAPLSRLEGQIAISTLVKRAPNLRLKVAPDQLRWRGSFIVRGLEALPVAL